MHDFGSSEGVAVHWKESVRAWRMVKCWWHHQEPTLPCSSFALPGQGPCCTLPSSGLQDRFPSRPEERGTIRCTDGGWICAKEPSPQRQEGVDGPVKLPELSHRCQGLVRSPPACHLESGTFASLVLGFAPWLLEAEGIL